MDPLGRVPAVPLQPRFRHLLERHLKREDMTCFHPGGVEAAAGTEPDRGEDVATELERAVSNY